MSKDLGKILAILASIAAIIGTCIAAIALIPAFGQWLNPREPVLFTPATNNISPNTVEVSPTVNLQSTSIIATLSSYSPTETPVPLTPTIADNVIVLDQSMLSNLDDFENKLETVELISGNRMRLNFSFWNKSLKFEKFGLTLSTTFLVDANGNKYEVVSDKGGRYPGNIYFTHTLEAGVKYDYWIEFPAPKGDAKVFTLNLIPEPGVATLRFTPFEISLP